MKIYASLLLLFASAFAGHAQYSRYIIQLKDKANNPFSLSAPQAFLSQKAIDRRSRYTIAVDSSDLPVTPRYIDSIRLAGDVQVLNISKWLNAVSISTTDAAALQKIAQFPFVVSTKAIALKNGPVGGETKGMQSTAPPVSYQSRTNTFNTLADHYNYGYASGQVRLHHGEFLHNIGLRGDGVMIGMLDAGYYSYSTLPAFDSVRTQGHILETWDFVNRETSVAEDNAHGMYCFSIMAANIPNKLVGTAPRSSYVLYRTEDGGSEYPIEEFNWVVGAERVDSIGGDLISSSLGYSTFDDPALNHSYADMNGNTTISAIGADVAAKKGILVVNAAGNEGNSAWKYISSPADGDSVLAVGAVDSTGLPGSFSSYGPSSDGQVKPDVASVGVATFVQATNGAIAYGNGTSFACPNMAGLTACLWQGFREFNNMKIIDALRRSSSRYTAPNDRVGYGIPDMKKAVVLLLQDYANATATTSNCRATINWQSKDAAGMQYVVERKLPGETGFSSLSQQSARSSVFDEQSYAFDDDLDGLPAGNISYRVKQVLDTSASGYVAFYIDTLQVNTTGNCTSPGGKKIQVSPNPAHNFVKIRLVLPDAIQKLTLRIVNSAGQTVYRLRTQKSAGPADFDIPVQHLAAGKYFLSIYNDEQLIATEGFLKL